MRNENGFTLTELLCVMAIIGILAAIALHRFDGDRRHARDANIMSTIHNVATREEAYYVAHGEYASDVASLSDLEGATLDDLTIAIGPGNSGTVSSSFHVTASSENASHTYTWFSDPAPGKPNLTAEETAAGQLAAQ